VIAVNVVLVGVAGIGVVIVSGAVLVSICLCRRLQSSSRRLFAFHLLYTLCCLHSPPHSICSSSLYPTSIPSNVTFLHSLHTLCFHHHHAHRVAGTLVPGCGSLVSCSLVILTRSLSPLSSPSRSSCGRDTGSRLWISCELFGNSNGS
jgi:hypothetical protein